MNQRRYIEHNLFLQSTYTKHINQVLLRSCESSYSTSYSKVLLRSYSTSYIVYITKYCEALAQNISPRNFNEFGNTFFYS